MIIQLKFTHNGEPSGREYAFYAPDNTKRGDRVIIAGNKKGLVTAINTPPEVIEEFKDKVKTIESIIKEDVTQCQ